ncbi:MAG TPA: aminotransferase class III-fold pyridoxal phosphate-dependent enzyme [Solirubrobacteraceae bacterium]|nr:aminotransferase class III-fold pyridoxal phosphate-dependent enzyme [Solirubrobacteraceae bacterium]
MANERLTETTIEQEYTQRTPGSARLMARASAHMPHGVTRTLSWFAPYPVVFERGSGGLLYDVDGNPYVDMFSNGLSLMHGHAYEPIDEALREALARGTAWPGASDAQVAYAELLCARVPGAEQVRFTNTGTEATMLAVKLARHATRRPVIVKAWHAYHGSYDDLEVGLLGQGEIPGRVALARFGELDSYRTALERHAGEVAAIIVEPVQYTGVVTPPPEGFLPALRELAREAGVLFVLDDCLMFRLAEGGSTERFGLDAPDITCLGKWVGGGLPVGAITASAELMAIFDPSDEHSAAELDGELDALYHGGSFNGNLLGMVAGHVAVSDLTTPQITRIDGFGERLRATIEDAAASHGVPARTQGVGSAFGLYVLDRDRGEIDWPATSLLHLAAVNHGVYYGKGGEFGLCTALSEDQVEQAGAALELALADVASALGARG